MTRWICTKCTATNTGILPACWSCAHVKPSAPIACASIDVPPLRSRGEDFDKEVSDLFVMLSYDLPGIKEMSAGPARVEELGTPEGAQRWRIRFVAVPAAIEKVRAAYADLGLSATMCGEQTCVACKGQKHAPPTLRAV